jgi:hypothetical protein
VSLEMRGGMCEPGSPNVVVKSYFSKFNPKMVVKFFLIKNFY